MGSTGKDVKDLTQEQYDELLGLLSESKTLLLQSAVEIVRLVEDNETGRELLREGVGHVKDLLAALAEQDEEIKRLKGTTYTLPQAAYL